MTKVSVVTTVYNGADYLNQVMESVLAQEYDDFEWVLVDDGSSDRSLEIMQNFASNYEFVHLYAPGRMGRCKALNFGIKKAEGEYIAIQDVDDISFEVRLSKQARFLDENPKVGAVGGFAVIRNEMRSEEHLWRPPTNHQQLKQALSRYVPIVHTLSMFRKEAWSDAGGYPTIECGETNTYKEAADNGLEDLVLWIEMVAAGWQIRNLETPLGEHNIYGESSWYEGNSYLCRQKTLAKVQYAAIERLDLPLHNFFFLLGRFVYAVMPSSIKSYIRGAQQRFLR